MSQPANPAQTLANFAVQNTTDKGSKQTPDNNPGYLPADRLREICKKHYNQILPIMAEKVHQEKLQGVQTRLTYGESSHRNSQTQFSESESCDRKKRPKKRRQSPVTTSRGTRPSQTASVFSRLRHERGKPTRQRSQYASKRRSTSKSAETLSRRRKDARELIRGYVTCSSERQQEIKEEWDAADRASRRPYTRTKELYHSENNHDQGGHWKSKKRSIPRNYSQQNKYIKDPVEIHHIKQREGEPKEAFMEIFKAESMHVSGAPECMRISGFMHGITNPDLIKKLNDNIPKSMDKMMSVTTAFLRGEVAAANQAKKKVPPAWKHHETSHIPNFDKRLDFKNQHKSGRRQDRFTPLTKTPKKILAMDNVKFKAPLPITSLAKNQNKNKFCEFHGDNSHSTDKCIHLKRQIEEAVKSGQLSHLVKEIKQ
ncbi:hypothetical protein Tco_0132985 [Tanacetum coccineum]